MENNFQSSILQIPNSFFRIAFGLEVLFVLKNKCHDEIHDDWRTYSEKREINKIHPDTRWTNAKFAAPPATDAECTLFEPVDNVSDKWNIGHGGKS